MFIVLTILHSVFSIPLKDFSVHRQKYWSGKLLISIAGFNVLVQCMDFSVSG